MSAPAIAISGCFQGCVADVADRDQCTKLVDQAASAFGGSLHVLVNNVGTNIRKPTTEFTSDDFRSVMGTNLESAYVMCQLCHPLLKASGNGCILFNSSVAGGPTAMRSGTLYSMTKAAMNQVRCRTKALECKPAALTAHLVHTSACGVRFTAK